MGLFTKETINSTIFTGNIPRVSYIYGTPVGLLLSLTKTVTVPVLAQFTKQNINSTVYTKTTPNWS